MNHQTAEKITIHLPHVVYRALRSQAHRQNLSLPEFIQQKIKLKPLEPPVHGHLSGLPLREILEQTTPVGMDPDERLDFFHD